MGVFKSGNNDRMRRGGVNVDKGPWTEESSEGDPVERRNRRELVALGGGGGGG